ncbi:MAG: ribonuclease M5 [Sporolactobacillus sp.]|jgi:ribonuclease M5|nr:ribonuclease M5 [Sporolactobacillus sp.]
MKVNEVIVVEGKSDTAAIRRTLQADTIETNGSKISRRTIEMIRRAGKTRGVIVFTDPDFSGERIRKIVSRAVPGCKHAFITRREGRGNPRESLGVEHASPDAIRTALSKVYTQSEAQSETITQRMLRTYGLLGGPDAGQRRRRLGDLLKIGYTNGKQLYKRLNMFRISPEELDRAMAQIDRGAALHG